MEYAKIGNTDIEVSKLCVGCMSFGEPGTMHKWSLNETDSEKVIKHAMKSYRWSFPLRITTVEKRLPIWMANCQLKASRIAVNQR